MNQLEVLHKVMLANGETITYRKREGGEEQIVLVHGNMTSSKHWDLLMEAMDARFTIYALDMRGFGGSTYLNRITSIKDFSDDLKLWLDELGLKGFTLVGWSTGGNVAMQFCADYPSYCHKLVLFAVLHVAIRFIAQMKMGHPTCKSAFKQLSKSNKIR